MLWYTIGRIKKKCYGMSTDSVRWLSYEMIEKIILKIMHSNNVGILDLSTVFDYKFY